MIGKKIKRNILTLIFLFAGSESFSQTESGLNFRQKSLVSIAALTASGNQQLLEVEATKALDSGLSINEAKEVLIQLAAYAGFPRSLNAINILKKVTEERKAKGINDIEGKTPQTLDARVNKYELGKGNLEKLSGKPETSKAGYAQFVPVIEVFLKEHLFADIFSRGVLSYQDRELVTVSALAALGDVDSQLQAHLNLSLYNGLTSLQLDQMFKIVGELVGKSQAAAGKTVLKKLLETNPK
ncbi:carboxymuconolactone decarboxylase family protein [Pedobacter sp. Leaf250]|uniref:carboxymuconolactone decarboxylase family protein n=1 Tax=Pedobacter sp. Leaf250 TaxID=2876559 RepID=UPI001E5B00C4|nr:carboxymuconolactone decarboxylase family protein [Pedobacter sp. Leaf250]